MGVIVGHSSIQLGVEQELRMGGFGAISIFGGHKFMQLNSTNK